MMKNELIETLNWEIKTQPVLFSSNDVLVEDRNYMHLSKSTGQPLSVMGGKYCPLTVEDFTQNVQTLSNISGYSIEGYQEFKGGRTILGILKADSATQASIPSDNYVIVGSSFDGTRPFFIGTTTVLIRCQNQFSQINIFDTVKHTKSSPFKREQLQHSFAAYLRDQQLIHLNFEKMDQIKITEKDKTEYARMVLNILPSVELPTITENRLDGLLQCISQETQAVGNTVFGMFQGVTKYTTHSVNSKESVFGNVFGTKDFYNQRAYNQALKLAS